MADKYRTFSELLKKTREGTHWRVVSKDRASGILVAAPHGGRAERSHTPQQSPRRLLALVTVCTFSRREFQVFTSPAIASKNIGQSTRRAVIRKC
jgi:Poly-gamma-glutamate hydrolase